MTKFSTESLEEKAEEISQKTYFKERECRGAGNIEKSEKDKKIKDQSVRFYIQKIRKRSQPTSSSVKA